MHGVSDVFLSQGFECFGFKPFIPVKEQQNPDPEFPTVKFPNPEEAGTSFSHQKMVLRSRPGCPRSLGKLQVSYLRRSANAREKGLAVRTAETTGATYVLAQDPDGDRFSAAERRYDRFMVSSGFGPLNNYFRNRIDGTWITFTGDQLGALFAGRTLELYKASGKPLGRT